MTEHSSALILGSLRNEGVRSTEALGAWHLLAKQSTAALLCKCIFYDKTQM